MPIGLLLSVTISSHARKSIFTFFKMRFFGTLATGGDTHLWLECDKRWNCTVLAMAVVRLPITSYWCHVSIRNILQ